MRREDRVLLRWCVLCAWVACVIYGIGSGIAYHYAPWQWGINAFVLAAVAVVGTTRASQHV